MLAVFKDRHDETADTRMWMTNELPDDIDDWPDGWRARLEARQDALADSEDINLETALDLAEQLVRKEFRELPPMLEVA